MKRWGLRHRGFRVGFIGVVVCSVFFVFGFAAPAWRNTSGLWMSCTQSHKLCASHASLSIGSPAWFDAVRSFECLALLAIMLCVAAEVYMDFLSQPSPDRRLVELLAMVGGTCGLVGGIIFAAFTPMTHSTNFHHSVYLSWGFGLATASSCFLIAFACVIAYFRRKGLDVASYAASNAIHYSASDGMVTSQGLTAADIAPPSYNEVVSQPPSLAGGGQGSSLPQSQHGHYKVVGPPDSQPPPAYFPPPPSGHFQAPPPYVMVPTSAGHREETIPTQPPHSGPAGMQPVAMASGPGLTNTEATVTNPGGDSSNQATDGFSGLDSNLYEDPAVSLPAYYVTVLGQMVPVYREELQQAGREVPTVGAPVPAYFIAVQGQHVPVYSEEQARTLAS